MSDVGRNDRCRCGSGKKTKRCCGVRRGPSARDLATALLAGEARTAAGRLGRLDVDDLQVVFDEMLELPSVDVSVQVPLPRLSSPAVEHLRATFGDRYADPDDVDSAVDAVLPLVDTPEIRAGLVRAVLALAHAGRVSRDEAAAAVLELSEPDSAFMRSSLGQTASVSAGEACTPAGLLVVSR